jgi:hypothetical protein
LINRTITSAAMTTFIKYARMLLEINFLVLGAIATEVD